MNGLFVIDKEGGVLISARKLHTALKIKQDFPNWLGEQINEFSFIERKNLFIRKFEKTGEISKIDYLITIDIAKQIIAENTTPEGREILHQLMEMEGNGNNQMNRFNHIRQLEEVNQKQIENCKQKLVELKYKSDLLNRIINTGDDISVRELALILDNEGLGEYTLFQRLRNEKYIDHKNRPYQEFINNGIMYLKIHDNTNKTKCRTQLRITYKGLMYFIKKYGIISDTSI
jgi:phage anti-repressor protein